MVMINVLSVLVPIFGLILLGWFLKHIRLLNDWLVGAINNYVYYIGISVITFINLHDTSTSVLLDPGIYILNLVPMLLVAGIAYVVAKILKLPKDMSAVFVVCAFYGNTGYIGFPLNLFVQGKSSLNTAAFISTLYTIVVFTLGVYLLKRNSNGPVEAGKLYKLPIIWAAVLGILLSWLTIPGPVRIPLEFISDSTSPLALLATGAMAEGAMLKADLKNIGVLSAIKLVVAPALVAVTGRNAGKHGRHVQDIPAGGGDAGRRDEHRAGLTVQDAGRICLPRGHHIDRTICPDNCDNINIFVKISF